MSLSLPPLGDEVLIVIFASRASLAADDALAAAVSAAVLRFSMAATSVLLVPEPE